MTNFFSLWAKTWFSCPCPLRCRDLWGTFVLIDRKDSLAWSRRSGARPEEY